MLNKHNKSQNKNNLNNNANFKKSKSKASFTKQTILSPKKNLSHNINYINPDYNEINTPSFNINISSSNKNNNNTLKQKIENNNIQRKNIDNQLLKSKIEEENSYNLLKEKYLEYLKITFDGNIPNHTKEEEYLNEKLLRSLAKNEVQLKMKI